MLPPRRARVPQRERERRAVEVEVAAKSTSPDTLLSVSLDLAAVLSPRLRHTALRGMASLKQGRPRKKKRRCLRERDRARIGKHG